MATDMEIEQPQPHANGAAAAAEAEEQLLFELADVELTYSGKDNPEGTGTLRVSSRRLRWEGAEGGGAFEAAVPSVTLHAISKDPSSFPKPCLYCQITEHLDEEEGEDVEVYFAPQDPESLPALFEAMSKAALMNPDPPAPGEEEGDDELIYDQAGLDLAGCTAEQAAMLGRLDSLMMAGNGATTGQFDDVEEEEEGEEGEEEEELVEGVNGHNEGGAWKHGEEEDGDDLPQ